MHSAIKYIAAAVIITTQVAADELPCPTGLAHIACDQWRVERAEEDIATAVDVTTRKIDSRSTYEAKTKEAKASLATAQAKWFEFRNAECKARSDANLISARPHEAMIVECQLALTQERIKALQNY
jgi:uncharacterized protein YecT (DUF1311 family)